MNLIKNCPGRAYEQFVDFLIHFFNENTIDSLFNEEELIIIIYLIIEDYFLNKLPEIIYTNNIDNKKKEVFLKDSILYEIFKSITRKPDVRNFTCPVLSEAILKLEGYKDILSVDTKILANIISRDENRDNQYGRLPSKKSDKHRYKQFPSPIILIFCISFLLLGI